MQLLSKKKELNDREQKNSFRIGLIVLEETVVYTFYKTSQFIYSIRGNETFTTFALAIIEILSQRNIESI